MINPVKGQPGKFLDTDRPVDGLLGEDRGSLIGFRPQQSKMQRTERPGDRITLEEVRLDLASRVGPLRLLVGNVQVYTLVDRVPVKICVARGAEKQPSYVRVELVKGYHLCDLNLSTQPSSSDTLTTNQSAYVDLILKAGEELWATAYNINPADGGQIQLKVTDTTV